MNKVCSVAKSMFFFHGIELLLHYCRGLFLYSVQATPHPRNTIMLVLAVIGIVLINNWTGFVVQTWQP